MFNFIVDIVDAVLDICETWREKNIKILIKLILTIIVLVFLIINAKTWL